MNQDHIIRTKFNKIIEKQNEIMDLIKDFERDLNNKIEYSPIFPKSETKYKSYSYDSGMYSGTNSIYDEDSDSDHDSYGNEFNIGLDIDEEESMFGDDEKEVMMSPNLAAALGLPSISKQKINDYGDKWVAPAKSGLQNSVPLI